MKKYISVVIPVYNEEEIVEELALSIDRVMKDNNYDYEAIFVNDGSSDNTWDKLITIQKKHPSIKGIDLAGNYGQTIALRAGIQNANGEIIICMDGDMQHDPKYIPQFINKIEEGYDMVGGWKEKRVENWFKNIFANLAHNIISRISGVKMKYFGATYKAYRSYLVKDINMLGDVHRFLGAIIGRKGVRYTEFPIILNERTTGKSNYKFKKVFLVIIDLIFLKFTVSYMNKPFRLFGFLGGFVFFAGFILTSLLIVGSLFFGLHLKEDYIVEFLFSVFLILIGMLVISFGLIAEMGIYNYYSKGNQLPYTIRMSTINEEVNE